MMDVSDATKRKRGERQVWAEMNLMTDRQARPTTTSVEMCAKWRVVDTGTNRLVSMVPFELVLTLFLNRRSEDPTVAQREIQY